MFTKYASASFEGFLCLKNIVWKMKPIKIIVVYWRHLTKLKLSFIFFTNCVNARYIKIIGKKYVPH